MRTIRRKLNIVPGGIPVLIKLNQYDSDYSLVFELYSTDGVFTVPSGSTAKICGTKRSGTGYSADASISGTTVTVTGDVQMTAAAGTNVYEIVLYNGTKKLHTSNIILLVERAALDADTITDETIVPELDSLAQYVAAAQESARSAAESAAEIDFRVDAVPTQGSSNAVSSGGVYSALAGKVAKPLTSPNGTNGQLLRTLGNGQTEWTDFATPTNEQVGEAVGEWLDDHPEATTTVQDGSLTVDKLAEGALGFVMPEQYGAVGDGSTDDTDAIQDAVDSGFPIRFSAGKTYIITRVTLYHGIIIDGNGATIKRPNLKIAPYEWTDTQIKANYMMSFSGENTYDKTSYIRNLNFDGNAWTMWAESDGYKYEQAQFIRTLGGTASHPNRLVVENCTFKDNFSSAISCVGYSYLTISNCTSTDCFKGIVTFVGEGSKLDMVNIKCFTNYNSFNTINIEINGNDVDALPQSNVNLTNVYVERKIKLGAMSGHGTLNANGLFCANMQEIFIATRGTTNITNGRFEFAAAENGLHKLSCGHAAVPQDIVFDNVYFKGLSDIYPCLSFRNQDAVSEPTRIIFQNCQFEHMESAVKVQTSNNYNKNTGIIFNECIFHDITSAIIKGDASQWHVKFVDFIRCSIDIGANAQILNFTNAYKSPIFTFDGNHFLSDNAGIKLYGQTGDNTLVFKDDFWEYGLAVSYYRSGAAYPKVFGHRYRIVENVPTEKGYNDCDIAIVTSESNAKYIYTNDAWTAMA